MAELTKSHRGVFITSSELDHSPDSTRKDPVQKGVEQRAEFLWVIRGLSLGVLVKWDTKTGSLCFRGKKKPQGFLG